jgi:hypothetical protein
VGRRSRQQRKSDIASIPKLILVATTVSIYNRRGRILDKDGLGLGVMSQSILSILTSETRLFEPTKRNLTLNLDRAIDLRRAALEFLDDAHRTVDVLREHRGGESKFRIVRLLNGLGLGFESAYHDDRSKDFLLDNLGVGDRILKDGRLDKQSLTVRYVPGGDEPCPQEIPRQ